MCGDKYLGRVASLVCVVKVPGVCSNKYLGCVVTSTWGVLRRSLLQSQLLLYWCVCMCVCVCICVSVRVLASSSLAGSTRMLGDRV